MTACRHQKQAVGTIAREVINTASETLRRFLNARKEQQYATEQEIKKQL